MKHVIEIIPAENLDTSNRREAAHPRTAPTEIHVAGPNADTPGSRVAPDIRGSRKSSGARTELPTAIVGEEDVPAGEQEENAGIRAGRSLGPFKLARTVVPLPEGLDGNVVLPRPAMNARKVAKGRREHFTGQLVVGDVGPDEGFGMDIESYTEFQVVLALQARPEVASIENQVPFEYRAADGSVHWHYFDFRAGLHDGSRTAIMVKSAYRYTQPKVRDELHLIARQVTADFADRVVVMTERDLDPIEMHNAEMMHEMRRSEPIVDAAARRTIQGLVGSVRIADLVERIGLGGQGYRAIVRLLRSNELKTMRQERISYETYVTRSNVDV